MRRLIAVPVVLVLSIVLLNRVTANEEEKASLMSVVENLRAGYEAGDLETVTLYIDGESKGFVQDGELLGQLKPLIAGDVGDIKALLDAGGKCQIQLQRTQVKVYGNTGIVTAYVSFTATLPDGRTQKDPPKRHSSIWVKMEGTWKLVHIHQSPLSVESAKELEGLGDI